MPEIHKLSKANAVYVYAEAGSWGDPEGKLLCDGCNMYLPGRRKNRGGCTAVRPNTNEIDGEHISATHGGCNVYMYGPGQATPENTNPNRLSKAEAGYTESREGFGCARCINNMPRTERCVRVSEKGGPTPGRIAAKACCNGWKRAPGY